MEILSGDAACSATGWVLSVSLIRGQHILQTNRKKDPGKQKELGKVLHGTG